MTTNHAVPQHQKVSTIELFFDLVFVFLITQLTHMVEHAHGWVDFVTAGVALVLLWWLYAAYVWLMSALGKEQRVRLVLLLAMAGFLLAAVALPRMATREGSVFAWAYLALVLLHSVTFWYLGHYGHRRAIASIAPFNPGAGVLVLIASSASPFVGHALLGTAAIGLLGASLLPSPRGFSLQPEHFAERHGLVILIVFGEAIVAIGTSASTLPFSIQLLVTSALGMLLIVCLWWRYFTGDDEAAQAKLAIAPASTRERLGSVYWQAHLLLIAGVVLISAGTKQAASTGGTGSHAGMLLGIGTALFLTGQGSFRFSMALGGSSSSLCAAMLALSSIALPIHEGRIAGLAVLVAPLLATLLFERQAARTLRMQKAADAAN